MKFSIIVVCLNPGEKLNRTLQSILDQTYTDYEIVVKDGGSRDGSVEHMLQDEKIKLYAEKDRSIYEAMNQAVSHTQGEYILFMNCGDYFYDKDVLKKTSQKMEAYTGFCRSQSGKGQSQSKAMVFYGDTYSEKNGALIVSPPKINGFACYRNIPCHQSCFYAAKLCKDKPYNEQYRIRADYDHFLWCYYAAGADMVNLGCVVSVYEGGGYSENKANRKRDKEEHKAITVSYMSTGELLRYRLIMLATLAPLRSILAENKMFSGVYHRIKKLAYRFFN